MGQENRPGLKPRILMDDSPRVRRLAGRNSVLSNSLLADYDGNPIYPTLTDLCGIPTPKHIEGHSIRKLLSTPGAPWTEPAVTTYKFKNHGVRNEDWRYIRYANGDEELYHESVDPYEWTNLATKAEFNEVKVNFAKSLPKQNHADIGGRARQGAEDFGDVPAQPSPAKPTKP